VLKIFTEKKLLINNGLLTEKKANWRLTAAMWVKQKWATHIDIVDNLVKNVL
jgi:hypothetical protein